MRKVAETGVRGGATGALDLVCDALQAKCSMRFWRRVRCAAGAVSSQHDLDARTGFISVESARRLHAAPRVLDRHAGFKILG